MGSTPLAPGAPAAAVIVVAAAVLAVLWSLAGQRRAVARRARVADPALASRLAWRTLLERLHDNGIAVGAHLTATEITRATAGEVAPAVSRLIGELAAVADRARFDPDGVADDDADLAWALTAEVLRRLPLRTGATLDPLRHPRRARRRRQFARGERQRSRRWGAAIPPEVFVTSDPLTPRIEGYVIDSQIGTGSTSTVYRATQQQSGRSVAIKVFAVDLTERRFDQQRFDWESRVALLVSGRPNLPEVLECGTAANGQPFLVTKLYELGTLFHRVQRSGPLSAVEVGRVGRELAMALESLHQNSIVHGDVKPENVFIDDDGSMILGDLGSAWLRADGGPATTITPPYAAPEVWLGHAPTVASDLFSLGLTLLFSASGRPPIAGTPPSFDELVEAFGSDVVAPLLELDPRRRPRTAVAAARQLGADVSAYALVGTTVLSLPTPTLTHRPLE